MYFEPRRIPGSGLKPGAAGAAGAGCVDGCVRVLQPEAGLCRDVLLGARGAHGAGNVIESYPIDSRGDRSATNADSGNGISAMRAETRVRKDVDFVLDKPLDRPFAHDAQGQLLTASLAGRALPRAAGIPMIKFTSALVPSTSNHLGATGFGRSRAEDALIALKNAVPTAPRDHGVRQADGLSHPIKYGKC